MQILWKKCNSYQRWNNNKCQTECKERHVCANDYIWNPAKCSYEKRKYLANIMGDLAIKCD